MKQKRYTDEQIAFALRQAESGTAVAKICRKLGPESGAGPSAQKLALPLDQIQG